MKLFVLGEKSANPDDWSIWSEWELAIAKNEEAALALGNGRHKFATEIPMTSAVLLASMSEPNWGEDL